MPEGHLRDHLMLADAELFAGREADLEVVDRLLDPDSRERILYVHGPGGIGKSALLRELRRRGERAGHTVLAVDGRTLPLAIDLLAERLTPPPGSINPIVVIDEVESLGASLVALREVLFDILPAAARVVVAGRRRADRSWLEGELEGVSLELALGPLSDGDAVQLLARRGVGNGTLQRDIVAWAKGSPLALALAASTGTDAPMDFADPNLFDRLMRHLIGREIEGIDPAVLDVASITWALDSRLIAAALPGRSTRGALTELLALSVVESVGHRAVLHPLLAQALRARLRAERPHEYRALVLRIADHLRTRCLDGDPNALVELTSLIENPLVRAGAGLGAGNTHYADSLRAGDIDRAVEMGGILARRRMAELAPWAERFPEFTTVVRRSTGRLAGIALCVPASVLLSSDPEDATVAPIVEHIRADHGDADRSLVLIGDLKLEDGGPEAVSELMRVGNAAAVTRSGIPNVRYIYVNEWSSSVFLAEFMASLGYRELVDMRRNVRGESLTTWLSDFGPQGLAGFIHSIVLAENGAPPSKSNRDGSELLRAVREFGDDRAMAARAPHESDPATGASAARAAVRAEVDARFDDSPSDRELHRVLEVGYLEPSLGERAILERLHLSRSAYYRKLREARERLVG